MDNSEKTYGVDIGLYKKKTSLYTDLYITLQVPTYGDGTADELGNSGTLHVPAHFSPFANFVVHFKLKAAPSPAKWLEILRQE